MRHDARVSTSGVGSGSRVRHQIVAFLELVPPHTIFDCGSLFAAVYAKRRDRGWGCYRLDCTPGRLANLRTARLTDLDLAMMVVQWLREPAATFIRPAQA